MFHVKTALKGKLATSTAGVSNEANPNAFMFHVKHVAQVSVLC